MPAWRSLRAAMSGLASAALVLAAPATSARPHPDQIAFSNTKEIYLVNTDGSGLRRLTHLPKGYSEDAQPAWSPDRKTISFSRQHSTTSLVADLFLVQSDGTGLRQLTHEPRLEPGDAVWSSRGLLAFHSRPGVWLAGPPTWKPVLILKGAELPSWSPDGETLVADDGFGDLITLDVRTHVQHVFGVDAGYPVWSPDGTKIAFDRQTADRKGAIYTMNTGGGGIRKVGDGDCLGVSPLSWSPDGRAIAAFDQQACDGPDTAYEYPLAGGHRILLGPGQSPQWAPDGKQLTVEYVDSHYDLQIALVNANGTGRHKLVAGFFAAWR